MGQQDLETLLAKMPSIAKAVNAFTSETVQKDAFSALVAAFMDEHQSAMPVTPKKKAAPSAEENPAAEEATTEKTKAGGKRRGATGGSKAFKLMSDLDLKPKTKQSFVDFVAEKEPRSNEDRYTAVVYYLEQVLGLPKITWHHIGTVFRLTTGWREPADVKAGLKMLAHRKGTVNISDYEDLKTTAHGRNFVEHDLPPQAKAKSKAKAKK